MNLWILALATEACYQWTDGRNFIYPRQYLAAGIRAMELAT